jgi:hypothetical protein
MVKSDDEMRRFEMMGPDGEVMRSDVKKRS